MTISAVAMEKMPTCTKCKARKTVNLGKVCHECLGGAKLERKYTRTSSSLLGNDPTHQKRVSQHEERIQKELREKQLTT